MASGRVSSILEPIRALFDAGTAAGFTDGELIDRFATRRDAVAEVAFAALVDRHGPMVLRVCRAVLRDPHDADDAFQAAFVVLARRARSIRKRDSVGPWLHGVALRVARCSLKAAARRRAHERRGPAMIEARPADEFDPLESGPALHEEVARLPEKYRAAVVLCYLEGLTHDQAADRLGWPVGTVRTRLSWARDRLRSRLARRGLGPASAILGAAPFKEIQVPSALAEVTIRAVMRSATAGAVPASVATLANEVLRSMMMAKLKLIAVGLVAMGIVGSAGGLVAARQGPPGGEARNPAPAQPSRPVADGPGTDGGDIPYVPSPAPRVAAGPRSPGKGPTEPPRVLAARLEAARRVLAFREPLAANYQISKGMLDEARGDVAVLTAELESYRDDLRDEIELLSVQLEMREAELTGADILLKQSDDRLAGKRRLLQQGLGGADQIRSGEQDTDYCKSQRDLKKAERREVETRINQVRRRLHEVEPIIKAASLPLKSDPAPTSPPPPVAPK